MTTPDLTADELRHLANVLESPEPLLGPMGIIPRLRDLADELERLRALDLANQGVIGDYHTERDELRSQVAAAHDALRLMLAGTQRDCGRICMPTDAAVLAGFAALDASHAAPAQQAEPKRELLQRIVDGATPGEGGLTASLRAVAADALAAPSLTVGERERFEEWYGRRRGCAFLEVDTMNRYTWDATREAWEIWQAGAAKPDAQAEPVAGPTRFSVSVTGKSAAIYDHLDQADVMIRVDGDFESEADRDQYVNWLCDLLQSARSNPPAQGVDRPAFEAWLKTKPDARFWNTTDAMFAAFQGGAQAPAAVPLPSVRAALNTYYAALDNREHGGVAASKALQTIESVMGMSWEGHRAALAAAKEQP